jgi:hypothetical protein
MKSQLNRRAPSVLFFLIVTAVGFPFFLLAFALSPLNDSWLRFVILALPFAALVALWLWSRKPGAEGLMGTSTLGQQVYPPGA